MSIITTAGAPPIFLSISYINSFADNAAQIVASSMQPLVHRIYQMDPTAFWQGSLGASDSTDETITVGLYQGVAQIAVSIDTIILLNHNLNNFLVEYCTDYVPGAGGIAGTGTWQTLVNVTGQDGADYATFLGSPIANVNGLRLTMHSTGPTANQQKMLGNFIAALSAFQLSVPPMRVRPVRRQGRVDVELADKELDTTYFGWSDNSFTLRDIEFEFDHLNVYSASDEDSLIALLETPAPFLVYPEPGDKPRNVYLCLFDSKSFLPDYSGQWKGSGRKIPFRLKQVGWI